MSDSSDPNTIRCVVVGPRVHGEPEPGVFPMSSFWDAHHPGMVVPYCWEARFQSLCGRWSRSAYSAISPEDAQLRADEMQRKEAEASPETRDALAGLWSQASADAMYPDHAVSNESYLNKSYLDDPAFADVRAAFVADVGRRRAELESRAESKAGHRAKSPDGSSIQLGGIAVSDMREPGVAMLLVVHSVEGKTTLTVVREDVPSHVFVLPPGGAMMVEKMMAHASELDAGLKVNGPDPDDRGGN